MQPISLRPVALTLLTLLTLLTGPAADIFAADRALPSLVVPYFEVDTRTAAGSTTLFAVRNQHPSTSVDVEITYYSVRGEAQRTDTLTLDPEITHTVNVRDVAGLATDPDGVARGFVIVESNRGSYLVGDFFQVDVGENFATGERMISTTMCDEAEIRFADFGAGTEIFVLLTSPQGADPATDPPSFAVTAVDEAGNLGTTTEVHTDQHLYFATAAEFTSGAFGSLIVDFLPTETFGGGWAHAVYSAGGRFSVGMGPADDSARRRRCPRLAPGAVRLAPASEARARDAGERPDADAFGEEAAAVDEPAIGSRSTSLLVLPFYKVDRLDPSGTTTLYAIRNTESEPIDVEIAYHAFNSSAPWRIETVTLGAGATRTVNVRDVPGLQGGRVLARGFVTIEGQTAGRIVGDFFQVDVGQNFATGDRLLDKRTDFCEQQEIRFADFGSGTEFVLLLTNPKGAAEPSVRVTPVDEAGKRLPSTDIFTGNFVYFAQASDFTTESFGTLVFDFAFESDRDQGWVYGVYSADGLFSVGLNGAQNPYSSSGSLCLDASTFPLQPE